MAKQLFYPSCLPGHDNFKMIDFGKRFWTYTLSNTALFNEDYGLDYCRFKLCGKMNILSTYIDLNTYIIFS